MREGLLLFRLLLVLVIVAVQLRAELHLTTSDDGYLTVIQGFAAQLECKLNTCVRQTSMVQWYKDDVLLFNGTTLSTAGNVRAEAVRLQHDIDLDHSRDCAGDCSDSLACTDGNHCLDNHCCPCTGEDFTLILRNLSFDDAGRYRCQLANHTQQLEFQVEVLESGLKAGFHENISYDHSKCCKERGISSLCQAMCKPSDMDVHHFDPTSCKTDDYKHFLHCATEGGNRSHVHCCKTQLVPSFCYDFCSGNFQMLRRSHRLCLYYLPEIFECYNRAYLPFPDPPENLVVNALKNDELDVCWQAPKPQSSNAHLDILYYTVHYKQIPSFPFLGGEDGIPLLSGDYEEAGGGMNDDDYNLEDTTGQPKRNPRRKKRQTWVFVTHNALTNDSQVREFKFEQVNTTKTCHVLRDLRASTRYVVFVTATNEHGTSVPSSRAIAGTPQIQSASNSSLPDVAQCCRQANVSAYCASKMCEISSPPSQFSAIAISTTCRTEWAKVSPCLAAGRNHTQCCLRKGVQHDCLKICSGAAEPLSVHSLLCLNLDLSAIYQCLREGYEQHPSPPENVTVTAVGERSVTVQWSPPSVNADRVLSYTVAIRRDEHNSPIVESHNATSPHQEQGLEPDTQYLISVRAETENGSSLPAIQVFLTRAIGDHPRVCTTGQPLTHPNGHRYYCGLGLRPCPPSYNCVVSGTETDSYCCPAAASDGFDNCCTTVNLPTDCRIKHCMPNATFPAAGCKEYQSGWLQCASDGQDLTGCCMQAGISGECLAGCRKPYIMPTDCNAALMSSCLPRLSTGLPQIPRNLELVQLNSSSVLLSWDASPSFPIAITNYTLQLFFGSAILHEVNVSKLSARFSDLQPERSYTVHVLAVNEKGRSLPSTNLTFTTPPSAQAEDDRPQAPFGLHVAWNQADRVNVSWNHSGLATNKKPITGRVIFSVYYSPSTANGSKWTVVNTTERWFVLEDLQKSALYNVFVMANNSFGMSRSSSTVTLVTVADRLALPEPVINLIPDMSNLTYRVGDDLKVKCSVDSAFPYVNVDLEIGEKIAHNEPGKPWVEQTLHLDQSHGIIRCSVSDTDGRQNRAEKRISVQFGPLAEIATSKVFAFEDLSASIICNVTGYPEPQVQWKYNTQPMLDAIDDIKQTAPNAYQHTLIINNSTGRSGQYNCIARSNGITVEANAELVINGVQLPVSPHLVLQCCADSGIPEACQETCGFSTSFPPPPLPTTCEQYANKLINCAGDERDHRDCCITAGMPSRCLLLCSPEPAVSEAFCKRHVPTALACTMRSHEKMPTGARAIEYEQLSPNSIRVHWDKPISSSNNNLHYYAFYYRPDTVKLDPPFRIIKTMDNSIVLNNLEPSTVYTFALTTVNSYGHSPYISAKAQTSARDSGGRGWTPVLAFLFLIAIVLIVVYLTRTNRLPFLARKMTGRNPVHMSDPSVAFENPGYGTEVQIRGLGGAGGGEPSRTEDWQSARLETAPVNHHDMDSRGMRYAKLT